MQEPSQGVDGGQELVRPGAVVEQHVEVDAIDFVVQAKGARFADGKRPC